jgi:biotin transport system permease protein
MIEGRGTTGTTPLHRLPAGAKLTGLAVVATVLFFVASPAVLGGAAAAALLVLLSTGCDRRRLARDLAMPVAVIAAVGLADLVFVDAATAAVVVPRLLALAFLAWAVVVTTTSAELLDTFERALMPFDRLGLIDAARASLTLSLALRFVPLIVEEAAEIREAQAARGLDGHPLAVIVPLVVRTLVRAEAVADAIDARGFPPPRNSNNARREPSDTHSENGPPHEHP